MTRLERPSERYRFDRSPYERPNQQWRCGRAAAWGKPCPSGPNGDGSCGGTKACAPYRDPQSGRWECRRPASAGGPCSEGPLPDGMCAHRMPPCVPRRTLRSIRGRLALLALLAMLAAIGVSLVYGEGAALGGNSLSAGPLSASHAGFVGDDCGACHAPHGDGLGAWMTAVFTGHEMTGACLDCHVFEGEQRTAHNMTLASLSASETAASLPEHLSTGMDCLSCHIEHVGVDGPLTVLGDAQCSTCHAVKMDSFADHVAFDPQFPSRRRTSVLFDHASHYGKHFPQAGAGAPEFCTDCHVAGRAVASVPTLGFEETCASCHAGDIDDRALTVFSLPELSAEQFMALDHEYLGELCESRGSPQYYQSLIAARAAVEAGDPEGDFEAIAYGEALDPVTQWAIGSDSDEIYDLAADEPVVDDLLWLYLDIAESGDAPLADLLEERGGGVVGGRALVAGLPDETLRAAVCAWTSNTELVQDPPYGGGWYVDGLAVRYLPSGHADPVMRAWLDLAVAAPVVAAEEGGDVETATLVRDSLTDARQGPGACTRCHGVSLVDAAAETDEVPAVAVDWSPVEVPWNPYVTYSHGPHVSILGNDTACTSCHRVNEHAAVADAFAGFDPMQPASSFLAIGMDRCVDCHAGNGESHQAVASDRGCLLCHRYHLDDGFSRQMADMTQKTE